MARRPDTPCADCGKLLWSGTTSLPAGQRRCRACRRARSGRTPGVCTHCGGPAPKNRRTCSEACARARRAEGARKLSALSVRPGPCDKCGVTTTRSGNQNGRYCQPCADALRAAHWVNKNHRRRLQMADTDITPEFIRALRAGTTTCPLCAVELTDEPGRPNTRHLDHVVPLAIGGTHTRDNVRVICRTCNLKRPCDGSDLGSGVLVGTG